MRSSFLASSSPDGLEYVYFEEGVGAEFEESRLIEGPLPDYVLPGVENEALAGVLAGVVGLIIVGGLIYVAASSVRRDAKQAE